MNVIDVTPRPAALSAIVRFLQSPVMTILGHSFHSDCVEMGNAALCRSPI